ncbi:MAG: TIM barrel protein [Parcubacteria group bacterium]
MDLKKYAAGKIAITIENISRNRTTQISYPTSVEELSILTKAIPDIDFTLDIGHCVQNGESFQDFLTSNVAHIKDIHLHNAENKGRAHFGLNKKGGVDVVGILRLLKKIKYNGFLTLEILDFDETVASWEMITNIAQH